MNVKDLVAIDVHTHAEVSCRQPVDEVWKRVRRRGEPVLQGRQAPDDRRDRRVLPRTAHRPRDVHGRFRARDRRAPHPEPGGHRRGAREQRHHDRLREHRSAQGQARRARGAAADRGRRHPRVQVPSDLPGLLSERPPGLPAVRGHRRTPACLRSSTAGIQASARACRAAAACGSSTRTRCTSTTSPPISRT